MSEKPKESAETERASMLNFAAIGTSQVGLSVTAFFAVLSGVTGQVVPAVIFTLSLVPQGGLCWLNWRHLRAYESDKRPLIEPQERAQRRCKDAFKRLLAPAVIAGASFLLVNVIDSTPEPVKFATPVPAK